MAAVYKYKGIQGNQYTDGKVEALNKDEAAFKIIWRWKLLLLRLKKISGVEIEDENKSKKTKRIKKKVPNSRSDCFY